MPKYIDADMLMRHMKTDPLFPLVERYGISGVIESFPAADVIKRKVGKWMKHEDGDCWYCSECKEDNYYAYSWNNNTGKYEFQDHYCPNCGAEMKIEDQNGIN